jgi:predicted XRE-type DNA-binding protein
MTNREIIVSEPAYWVEDLNGKIYDAIVRYMEARNFKQKDMAKHLEISAGRMSQILHSGDINFSYSKIVSILLKLDIIPHFDLERKSDLLKRELHEYAYLRGLAENKPFDKLNVKMKVVSRSTYKSKVPVINKLSEQRVSQVGELAPVYGRNNSNLKRQIA